MQSGCFVAPLGGLGKLTARPRRTQTIRAAAEGDSSSSSKPRAPTLSSKDIGPIEFPIDNETFQDVMAFKGPAPEVSNPPSYRTFVLSSLQNLSKSPLVTQC